MDDEARATISDLLASARHAALAVIDPEDGLPNVSRIAFARTPEGAPMTLISDLSGHAEALKNAADAALLVGEPGAKGDPLTHPRLSLRVKATFHRHGSPTHAALAKHYVQQAPKVKLYIGFGDFSIVTFEVRDGFLNGGFGKAYPVTAEDVAKL